MSKKSSNIKSYKRAPLQSDIVNIAVGSGLERDENIIQQNRKKKNRHITNSCFCGNSSNERNSELVSFRTPLQNQQFRTSRILKNAHSTNTLSKSRDSEAKFNSSKT